MPAATPPPVVSDLDVTVSEDSAFWKRLLIRLQERQQELAGI